MGGIPAPQSLGTPILGFGVRGFPPRACPRAREPSVTPKHREPPQNKLPAAPPQLRRPHAAAPRAPAARGPPGPRPFTLCHAPFPLIGRAPPRPLPLPRRQGCSPRTNGGVPGSARDVIADVMCRPMGGGGAGLRGKQTPHVAAAGRGTRAGGTRGTGGALPPVSPPPVPPGARGAPTRSAPPRLSPSCPVPVTPVPLIATARCRRGPLRSP